MVAFWAFTDKSWGTRLAGLLYEIPLIVWQDAQKAQHGIVVANTESIVVITFSLGERTSGGDSRRPRISAGGLEIATGYRPMRGFSTFAIRYFLIQDMKGKGTSVFESNVV